MVAKQGNWVKTISEFLLDWGRVSEEWDWSVTKSESLRRLYGYRVRTISESETISGLRISLSLCWGETKSVAAEGLTYSLNWLAAEDGQWSSWSSWSGCNADCGYEDRKRECGTPPSNGGRDCQGVSKETRRCSEDPTICEGSIHPMFPSS